MKKSSQIVYEAISNGKLIFCRDRESFIELKVRKMLIYLDTAYLRDMVNKAFMERLRKGGVGVYEGKREA